MCVASRVEGTGAIYVCRSIAAEWSGVEVKVGEEVNNSYRICWCFAYCWKPT